MDAATGYLRAGFAIRLAALWVDVLLVCLSVSAASAVSARFGIYVPFELTVLLTGIGYSAVLLGWKQTTAGKALWGLQVRTGEGKPIGWARALWRETAAKLVSAAFLGLGFIRVIFVSSKRGWHDLLSGTAVVVANPERRRRAAAASLASAACVALVYAFDLGSLLAAYVGVAPPMNARPRYADRPASALVEVSSLSPADESRLAEWVEEHGREPIEYAVARAQQYRLVIFGEEHEQRESLQFLNRLIPELYHRAGITCVAMEVLKAHHNRQLERLVTAPAFDRAAALDLARATDPWKAWGFQEYWDVMETVWKLNRSLPPGRPRLRLVGLANPADLQSIAMISREGENPSSHVPWFEKLRLIRFPLEITRMAAYDTFMAFQAERQLFAPGARGIIWVGAAHARIHVPSPSGSSAVVPRMGFTLARKHPGEVFTIYVHHRFRPNPGRLAASSPPQMTDFVERVMELAGGRPAGFDLEGTPFGRLRDSGAFTFLNKRVGLADVASGYLYLGKLSRLTRCAWTPDYITPRMFAENKPFYRSWGIHFGHSINTAADFNRMMAEMEEKF